MKTTKGNRNPLTRVTMEPDVEKFASLWPANKRIRLGKKFKRWGHQLCLSGEIMLADDARRHQRPKPVLRFFAGRQLRQN
jgi:hypothetical protein